MVDLLTKVEPRYNDHRYNDILGITVNVQCPCKSYSTTYGTEPRYNDIISTQSQFEQNIKFYTVIE